MGGVLGWERNAGGDAFRDRESLADAEVDEIKGADGAACKGGNRSSGGTCSESAIKTFILSGPSRVGG